MLNIIKKEDANKVTLSLEGRLDINTAPLLEDALKEVAAGADIILDLEKMEYISSAGLRVLLSAQKRTKDAGSLKLIHVAAPVMEIFEVTGFSDILDIE